MLHAAALIAARRAPRVLLNATELVIAGSFYTLATLLETTRQPALTRLGRALRKGCDELHVT